MGIKIFIYALFILSLISYFYKVDVDLGKKDKEERPLLTFDNATMYTIDEYEVRRVVQAKIAAIFEKKEELFDAIIVERVKDEKNEVFTDTIRANYLLKEQNFVTMRGDVKYNRGSQIVLNSDELYYDIGKMVGYNKKPFELLYDGQLLVGENIYFDGKNSIFEAEKSHFEIEMNNKDNNETN